jgi:hypothetical protein
MDMFRRLAIATLWFVSFLCLHELAWSVFGSPRVLGIVIGGAAAAFFYFDPARLFIVAELPMPDTTDDRRLTRAEGIPVSR